jgi:hypothetical protein
MQLEWIFTWCNLPSLLETVKQIVTFFFFFFFLPVLEFELSVSACWADILPLSHDPCFFGFSYFSNRVSYFCPHLALVSDLPPYASQIAGITDAHYLAYWLRWGLINSLSGLAWKWDLCLSIFTSWVVQIAGMSHCTQPEDDFTPLFPYFVLCLSKVTRSDFFTPGALRISRKNNVAKKGYYLNLCPRIESVLIK